MNKLLFFLSVISFSVEAQLTLTFGANSPTIGTQKNVVFFDSTTAVSKVTGINKNWNFSSLISNTSTSTPSLTFGTASTTPFSWMFPSANIAGDDGNGYCVYYNSQPSSFDQLGSASSGYSAKYGNPYTEMIWPFTLGSNFNDAFTYTLVIPPATPSVIPGAGNMTVTGTGTGTVTLPSGQKYTNCLQVVRTITVVVSGASTSTVNGRFYEYWTAGFRTPIITVNYTTSKQATVTQTGIQIMVSAFADVGLNENELIDQGFVVYPNPAKEKLNVMFKDNAIADELELYDAVGKLVLAEKNTNTLDVSKLSKGIYTVKVRSKNSLMQKQVVITE